MRLGSLIHIEDRKYDQALTWARKARDLDPNSAYGHHLLGRAHRGLHQNTEAADEFEKAIALSPSFPDPYPELGLLYSSESSTFALAAQRFEKAISLGFDHPEMVRWAILLKALPRGSSQELRGMVTRVEKSCRPNARAEACSLSRSRDRGRIHRKTASAIKL